MGKLIAALVWLLDRVAPRKTAGRHARPKCEPAVAPVKPMCPAVPESAAEVPEAPEALEEPAEGLMGPLVRLYMLPPGEQAAILAERAAQRRRREELLRALDEPVLDWTVSVRAESALAA